MTRGLLVAAFLFVAAPNAQGAVAVLNAWTNNHSSAPNNISGTITTTTLTVSAGAQRLFLVAAVLEVGTGNTTMTTFSATFGGVAMHPIATTAARSGREFAGMWYLLDSEIPAGAQAISVSYALGANTVTGIHVKWASYTGVDQTTPINSSAENYSGAATVTFGTQVNYVQNGLTVYATGNGGSPATHTPPSGFTSLTGTTTSAHSSFIGETAAHGANGNYAGTTTVTFGGTTSARSVVVVASMRPTDNGTVAGTASAAQGTGATPTISVSAPYTGDDNANNTLSYRYRLSGGAYGGSTSLPHSASPYTFSISSLTCGSAYDVEVTYNDADGVTGTQIQTVSASLGNCTTAGTASASQGTGSTPTISVSAPYTNDANANNTLSYRYRLSGGAYGGTTSQPHSASPYTFTISSLTCGSAYDVEVTYNDTDGISGTQVQTVSTTLNNCTTAGTPTATVDACDRITVSAPFSFDANGNGSVSFERSPNAPGSWVAVPGCGAVGGASPRACVDTGLTGSTTYYYRVTYSDADSVTGTAQQVIGPFNTPACVVLPVTTGAPTASPDSCSQITVSAPFTGDTNGNSTTSVEYNTTNNWPGTTACASLTGASPRTCPVPGLGNATAYYVRVTFTDADGVNGTNPQVIAPVSTLDCRVTPGAPSASAAACTRINVSAPFTGDADGDSTTFFSRGPSSGGPWTAVCSNVSGVSPRACVDNGVAENSSYWYKVEFADPDGVLGTNPQFIGPYTTPFCAVNNTTTGTASAVVSGCSQITVSAPFSGDEDGDGSVLVEYNTSNTWPGTTACSAVGGASPRVCLVTGLAASTAYYIRATYSDPDGVSGTPVQVLPGSYTTTACSGNSAAPMILFLSPARDAVVGGTERFKVQVYDPDGVLQANVLWGLDGAAPASPVIEVTGFDCNMAGQTACKLFYFDVNTTLLANGSHYATVKATDSAATPSVAQVSRAFRASNSGGVPTGAGTLLRRTLGSQLCADCHNLETHTSQANSFRYGSWAQDCLVCHTPHETSNIFLVRPQIETPNSGKQSVDFRNTTGKADFSFATVMTPGNGVCEVCHTKTKNSDSTPRYRNTGGSDGGKHYSSACTGCHAHAVGFAAGESVGGATCSGCHPDIWNGMNGAVAKTSKHTIGNMAGTNDATTDSGITWGNPLSANAATARSCVNMCHDDHPHTLTSPLTSTHENNAYRDATSTASRAAGSRTSSDKDKTDFEAADTNGGMCLSCHRNPVDASHPAVDKAAYDTSAHDYTTFGAYGAWTYTLHDGGTFNRNCTKCHADGDAAPGASAIPFGAVHFSAYPGLLAGSTNPNGSPATFVCYTCHGNGTTGTNRSGKDIATQIAKTYFHPVNADNVHNTATESSATYDDGKFSGANRHVNCLDCHAPHEAGNTLHTLGTNAVTATSPLYGNDGVSFTSATTTNWPTTATGNFARVSAVSFEYQVCIKCHSSFAFGTTPPTGGSGAVETDVAREFNTGNQSYHSVFDALPATDPSTTYGSNRLVANQLNSGQAAPLQNWTPGQTMYCSDCHGNEATTPEAQGPHGSAVKFILRGPNTYWPTNSSGAKYNLGNNTSGTAFLAGLFCMNCHPIRPTSTTWANNVHQEHAGPQGNFTPDQNACVACHILVPHGGKVSRLIATRTAGLPARYAYQGDPNNVWATAFIKASTPTGYNTGNCSNAGCSGHSAITGETW